jgi:hypothetical protein
MKKLCFAFICLLGPAVIAAGPELRGPAFQGEKIDLLWSPTNKLPLVLWIYKVEAQKFPSTLISNVMALGKFTEKDRKDRFEGQPPFKDKRFMYYADKEVTRQLEIYPPFGHICYTDNKAETTEPEEIKGVPTQQDLLTLGLSWVDKLGIPRSELARKEGGSEFDLSYEERTLGWFDKDKNHHSKVNLQGIMFIRSIDGVHFTGIGQDGGLCLLFGNEGKIYNLELVWRKLKRYKSCKVASPAQLMDQVKRGETKVHPFSKVDLSNAKKMTIIKASPAYMGQSGDEPQDFMCPYISLTVSVEFEHGTNALTVLQCPLMK